jgi:hypothetical protein
MRYKQCFVTHACVCDTCLALYRRNSVARSPQAPLLPTRHILRYALFVSIYVCMNVCVCVCTTAHVKVCPNCLHLYHVHVCVCMHACTTAHVEVCTYQKGPQELSCCFPTLFWPMPSAISLHRLARFCLCYLLQVCTDLRGKCVYDWSDLTN